MPQICKKRLRNENDEDIAYHNLAEVKTALMNYGWKYEGGYDERQNTND